MKIEKARELAAQIWCAEGMKEKVMDPELAEAFAQLLHEKTGELVDFAIWMTGCGYNFAQLPYFCEQRDKLLKEG